jgi:hypothetical protein
VIVGAPYGAWRLTDSKRTTPVCGSSTTITDAFPVRFSQTPDTTVDGPEPCALLAAGMTLRIVNPCAPDSVTNVNDELVTVLAEVAEVAEVAV